MFFEAMDLYRRGVLNLFKHVTQLINNHQWEDCVNQCEGCELRSNPYFRQVHLAKRLQYQYYEAVARQTFFHGPFVGTLSFHTLSQIYLPNIKQVLLKEHLRQINKQNECLQESRLEVLLVWIFLKGITLTFINNGQTIQLHLYQKGKDLLLGQSKVNKVKIVLPFLKFMKRPQTKFYADTMHHSKVIRSKKSNIYH